MTGSEIKEQVDDAVACDDMFYRHELRDAIFDMVDENAKLRDFAKSYLAALKWHDEHVPRPTNPNATCVVLQGERPPEEVLFVREDGEVTHYLPEGTCANEWAKFGKFKCSKCGLQVDSMSTNTTMPMPIRHCPNCGRRLEVSDR